jgi:hypothetical protein
MTASRSGRLLARCTGVLLATAGLAASALLLGSPAAQAADPSGCGYGTGGPNSGTLCWLDMSGYDDATARSAAGQSMSISLPGGYTATFVVTSRPVSGTSYAGVEHRAAPLETRFAYGQTAYVGVPGQPILYSLDVGDNNGVTLALSDIQVRDSAGTPVQGYSFVVADAENNIAGENFTWTSDQPLHQIAVINPGASAGCTLPLSGEGTSTVTCTGKGGGGGPYNEVLVSADTPSSIGLSMTTFARSGIAFAIETSKITFNKSVDGRVDPGDSFDLAVTSPEGTVVGSATTGTTDGATTGGVTVLPRTNGAVYTLSESGTSGSGTDPGLYTQSWSCTNAAESSSTVLPSGSGLAKTLSPQPGDDITCTVTNTAPVVVDTPLVSPETATLFGGGALIVLLTVFVLGRRRAGGTST